MVLTGETEVLVKESLPVPFCPPHVTWTGLVSQRGLCNERPANDHPTHVPALKTNINLKHPVRTAQ